MWLPRVLLERDLHSQSPAGKATVRLSVLSKRDVGPQGVAERGAGREGCTVPSPSFLAEPCCSAGPPAPQLEEHLDQHSSEETFAHSGWRIEPRWPRSIPLQVCWGSWAWMESPLQGVLLGGVWHRSYGEREVAW